MDINTISILLSILLGFGSVIQMLFKLFKKFNTIDELDKKVDCLLDKIPALEEAIKRHETEILTLKHKIITIGEKQNESNYS